MTTNALDGRRAVITGASSGIGAATARALAAAGAHVMPLARRADRVEALARELGGTPLVADVGDRAALAAAAAEAGAVDILVANAGVMLPAPVESQPSDDVERMLAANLTGLFNTVQAFAPAVLANEHADLAVVSSIGARKVFPAYSVYGATKAAASAYAAGVRAEWAPRGVRVTTIEPGLTRSELRDHVRGELQTELDGMFELIAALSAEDVADTIAFAVSRPPHVNLEHVQLLPTMQP